MGLLIFGDEVSGGGNDMFIAPREDKVLKSLTHLHLI